MKISDLTGDKAVMSELGQRMARLRLEHNLTQGELAQRAGVSKRTVERLESGGEGGEGTRMAGFIRVCRALGALERLDALFPPPTPSPIEQAKLAGRQRRRASGARAPRTPDGKSWTWDDRK